MSNRVDDLLALIRQRPIMYIGEKSIFKLSTFLDGYTFALYQLGVAEAEHGKFGGFQEFVESQYQLDVSRRWDAILWFETGNEVTAFDEFWRLWDEFSQTEQ